MAGLGKRLKRLRKERDLSQDELGDLLKINGRQLSRYENDKAVPTGRIIQKYADFFGVATEELLKIDEELPEERIQDRDLLRLVSQMEKLNEDEKNALKKIIQAVITKNQIQSFILQQGC